MANDVSGRPWRLDTVGWIWPPPPVGGFPSSFTPDGHIKVEHIEFTGYTAQGHQVILKDKNNKIIWSTTGAGDLSEIKSGKIGWVDGLQLDTLDSGVVTVFVE